MADLVTTELFESLMEADVGLGYLRLDEDRGRTVLMQFAYAWWQTFSRAEGSVSKFIVDRILALDVDVNSVYDDDHATYGEGEQLKTALSIAARKYTSDGHNAAVRDGDLALCKYLCSKGAQRMPGVELESEDEEIEAYLSDASFERRNNCLALVNCRNTPSVPFHSLPLALIRHVYEFM